MRTFNHPRRCVIAAALVAVLTNSSDAQIPVDVLRLDGSIASGRLTSMTSESIRLNSDGEGQSVRVSDVLSLTVADLAAIPTPRLEASGWTLLASGDWLRLQALAIDDESILARWADFPSLAPLSVPLEVCRGLTIRLPTDRVRQGQIFTRLMNRDEESDELVLRNGDRISGTFVELSNGQIRIETSAAEVPVEFAGSESLAFNPDLVSTPDLPKRFSILVLSDGSTLWAKSVESDGDALLVEAIAGFSVAIPATVLREIRFYSERCVPLSSKDAATQHTTPFLSARRTPRKGSNVLGGPLSVAGRRFGNGTGVSSGTSMTWTLDENAVQFVASVGIDDAALGQGSVVFEVLLDGETAWKSDRLTGRDAAVSVPPVDLTDAAELTLRTHFADRGHVFDFANWCDPLLILAE